MNRRSTRYTATDITFDFHLVFGDDGQMRMSRTEPGLARNERAMACNITLPKALWKTPSLKATIVIPDTGAPLELTAKVDAAAEALRGALGVDIDLQVVPPDA